MATATKPKADPTPKPDPKPDPPAAEPETTTPEDLSDATPEELADAAAFGVTLDQLRAIRAQAATDINAAVVTAGPAADYDPHVGICGACHPAGWPTPDADYSECEHGTWTRHGYEDKPKDDQAA